MPYKRQFLDTKYGIPNEGVIFKFGVSVVVINTDSDIKIKEEFLGSEGLWELLTHKNVNRQHVT